MWENILKRRPLKINKPQKVLSPEEIDEIKEKAVSLLIDVKIIELYMEYLQDLPDDAEPSHHLYNALFTLVSYTNRALERTRRTQRFIFEGKEISLLELFNNLDDIIYEALNNDKLPDLDIDTLKKVRKDFDDFRHDHNEYLIQQNKLYLAERGKLFG